MRGSSPCMTVCVIGEHHDRPAAARCPRSHRGVLHPSRHRQGRAACRHLRCQGRDPGDRRRIRLGQVGDVVCGDAHSRPCRPDCRGLGDVFRRRRQGGRRERGARPARTRDLDDLSESARSAQSDSQGRPADRGCAEAARAGRGQRSRGEGDRCPRAGQDRPSARALPCLSVRIVRRHVPACRHRAGTGLQSAASDRRRADHRPRRHHPEGGDGSDRRADEAPVDVDDPDHPRSWPRRRLLRPRRGDGEGPCGRDRKVGRHLRRAPARLYEEADARDAAARRVAEGFVA